MDMKWCQAETVCVAEGLLNMQHSGHAHAVGTHPVACRRCLASLWDLPACPVLEAMAEAVAACVAALEALAQPSACLDRSGRRALARANEAGKEVLLSSFKAFQVKAAGLPMLTTKSCDGTPLTCVAQWHGKLPSGQRLMVAGKQAGEYLVKNQFARVLLPEGHATKVLLQEPVPLLHGKGVDAIWTACSKDWLTLRQLGHQGLVLEHYAFDRFGIKGFERRARQWHQWLSSMVEGDQEHKEMLARQELVVITPCAAHDAHNAFKWAMMETMSDPLLLRDIYIAMASIRNSWDLIQTYLLEWIASNIHFQPPLDSEEQEQLRTLWRALGVELETAEILASVLQVSFKEGQFCASSALLDTPDWLDLLSTCLLSTFRIRKFTESRWLTVGACSRTMVASLFLGMDSLIAFIEEKGASLFYLNGYKRLGAEHKRFLVKASMVSRVSEAMLEAVLEDPRVAVTHDHLCHSLAEELLWLTSAPLHLWQSLAQVSGGRAEDLMASCIKGGHISFHFIWRRVLAESAGLPWSLCRGDITQNLADLAAMDKPQEVVSQQLWCLLRIGFPLAQLRAAVQLLGEIGWATLPAEQQHGSLAVLKKWHPEYTREALIGRAFILQLCRLLPSQSQEEKMLARLNLQIRRLEAKQPQKAQSGRHAVLSQLWKLARSRTWDGSAHSFSLDYTHEIMKRHAAFWAKQNLAAKLKWERKAKREAMLAKESLEEELEATKAARALLLDRMVGQEERVPPILMSSASLSDEDVLAWAALLEDKDFCKESSIVAKQTAALRCPLPLNEQQKALLDSQSIFEAPQPPMPAWGRRVAVAREHFEDVVFQVSEGDAVAYFKFLYAVQNPTYLAFGKLQLIDKPLLLVENLSIDTWEQLDEAKFHWHCNFADLLSSADLATVDIASIQVIQDCFYAQKMEVLSESTPQPLEVFLDNLPLAEAKEPKQRARKDTSLYMETMVQAFPWLQGDSEKHGFSSSSAAQPLPEDTVVATQLSAMLEEDTWLENMRQLETARAQLNCGAQEEAHFHTKVLGGAWAMSHLGTPYDAVQGACRGALAEAFCRRRRVQKSMRFNYNLYGASACAILARAWCHKMEFFLQQELQHPDGASLAFTPAMLGAYEEPSELRALLEGAPPSPALQGRVNQIRALFRA